MNRANTRYVLLTAIVTIISFAIVLGCKKDKCKGISCVHGTCANGYCVCDSAYGGTLCDTLITGVVTFWTPGNRGNITVTCNNITDTITTYFPTKPNCGTQGCFNLTLAPGTYQFTGKAADGTLYGGVVTSLNNGCYTEELY